METDEEEGNMPEAERLVQHSPGSLREPVVDPTKDAKQHTADQHIVKMRYDEIGVGQMPIEGNCPQHDSRQPCNQELKEEGDATEHRQLKADLAAVHRAKPVEYLDPGGHANEHCGDGKKRITNRGHADREHVMSPDTHTDEGDHRRCPHHGRVAEDRLARKDWDDFRDASESG